MSTTTAIDDGGGLFIDFQVGDGKCFSDDDNRYRLRHQLAVAVIMSSIPIVDSITQFVG
jgi:hypothetical protein